MKNYYRPKIFEYLTVSLLLACTPVLATPGTKISDSTSINSANTVRKMLGLGSNTKEAEFVRIINARSLDLPDDASWEQISSLATRKQLLVEAKRYNWPLKLSNTQLQERIENRKRQQLCYSCNLPETASEAELAKADEARQEQSQAIMAKYGEIQSKKLTPEKESEALAKVQAEEKELSRAASARLAGLPITATWSEIEKAQRKQTSLLSTRELGIAENSSAEAIRTARLKQAQDEKQLLIRRIFKAPSNASIAQLNLKLKMLATALGYPKDPLRNPHHNGAGNYLSVEQLLSNSVTPTTLTSRSN